MDLLVGTAVFAVAFVAAFIDVMVGGGGLITVPALSVLGFPILSVIGTNRLYVVVFCATGLANYLRKKVNIDVKLVISLALVKMAGAAAGSFFVLNLPADLLRYTVVTFVSCVLILILALKVGGIRLSKFQGKKLHLIALVIFLVGFYEGVVGGGGGIIGRILLTSILGMGMLEAAAADLAYTIPSSALSSGIFILSGSVDFVLLVPMVAGGVLGAYTGTRIAIKKGDKWVERLLYAAVTLLLAKLLFMP
ncbi:sulfite exporter TauE/SafE family protein [Candidatus Parvarchaeota archaeon]|nr:sulfite exporter TauE/SafE family protein [Candidatus Parvarchaeota archaeon]